jgi:predicted enzyme related to lactoylglutathione lyase
MGLVSDYSEGVPSWVDLGTTDTEAASNFYKNLFGWELRKEHDPEGNHIYTTCLLNGKSVAGIYRISPEQDQRNVPPNWTTYIAVDDAQSVAKRAEALGAQILIPPTEVYQSGTFAVVAEPAGSVFGLWQSGEHRGAELVNDPGSLSWNELASKDIDRAEEFFSQLFGWKYEPLEGSEMRYDTAYLDGARVGAVTVGGQVGVPSSWLTYFAVANCDAACETIKSNGGNVVLDPTDINVGRMAIAQDPQGAVFAVIQMTVPVDR